jgi:Zn-dependent protease with chaperone function
MKGGRWPGPRTAAVLFLIGLLLAAPVLADYREDVGKGLNFFSRESERSMGQRYSEELNAKLPLITDPFVTEYIDQLGRKLVDNSLQPDMNYHFFVVNDREINAFALPGGYIYVNRGLIEAAEDESEVAGVLGHEIGHVVGRHSTNQMSKQLLLTGILLGAAVGVGAKSEKWGQAVAALGGIGVFFTTMKFSRDHERQADWLGMQAMAKAGYDPQGLIDFFRIMDTESRRKGGAGLAFMNTHPLPAERVRNMTQEVQTLTNVSPNPIRQTYSFTLCKQRVAQWPAPPTGRDLTLTAALASLDTPDQYRMQAPAAAAGPVISPNFGTFTYNIPGNSAWVDTGLDVAYGQAVAIAAQGQLFWKKNSNEWCGPDGAAGTGKGFWKPIPAVNTGALIARIGENTTNTFPIGSRRYFQAPATGRLYLGINDDNNFDNRGFFQVVINIGR